MKTREISRTEIDTRAQCRTTDGALRQVSLVDVSNGGCKICDDRLALKVGQPIMLLVAASAPLRAIVRWNGEGEAGIAFTRPLTDAQVDHLRDPEAANAEVGRSWNPAPTAGQASTSDQAPAIRRVC